MSEHDPLVRRSGKRPGREIGPDDDARVGELLRSMRSDDLELEEPPADLWSRIEQQLLGADDESAARVTRTASVVASERGRRRWARPALAAAAVVAVLGGITAVIARRDEEPVRVAVVDLSNDGLDPRGRESHGTAEVLRLDDGRYALDITVADLPTEANGFFELWVIDPDVEGMVSLGPLHDGRVVLPTGVDPQHFPIVDVSIEPVDGVPTHSGDSILRGVIQA